MGDDAGILGVDDGGSARHRHDVVDLEGAQNLELAALVGDDDLAVGAADDVVVVESAAVGLEASATDQDDLVEAPLRVADLDAVTLGEGASAGGLAIISGCFGIITLNSHYVKNSASGLSGPCQDADGGGGG